VALALMTASALTHPQQQQQQQHNDETALC